MKFLFWFLMLLGALPVAGQDNIGFEQGNFDGWTLSYGRVSENGQTVSYNNETKGTFNEGHKITSVANGRDPLVPAISMAAPGSKFSARIGNASSNSYFDKISTSFVATQEKSMFLYKFAVVLQTPGHAVIRQPAFSISVQMDGENTPCGFYEVTAGRGIPGFVETPNFVYRNWTTGSIDLRNYIGKTVTISIRTHDCTESGHWGYAYFDAELTKAEIKTGVYCQQDSTVILSAPDGFADYEWFNGHKTRQVAIKFPAEKQVFVKIKPFTNLEENCQFRIDFNPATVLLPVPITLSACEGELIHLAGQKINAKKTETIYLKVPRAGYCDSIVTVHLNVKLRPVTNRQLRICEGEFIQVGNQKYTKSGLYSDTLKITGRCDSIVNTSLTVTTLSRYFTKISICEEEKYMLGDTAIRHTGTYTRRIGRLNLCDSIATVELNVIPLARTEIKRSLCEGDSLMIGSTTLKTAGTHIVRINRTAACDSIVTVSITMFDQIPLTQELLSPHNYTLTLGEQLELKGELNLDEEFTYDWYTDTDILTCSTCPNIMVKPTNTATYSLTYNKDASCETTIRMQVSVKPCPMSFPQVFTPNHDRFNNDFKVFCNCIDLIENFTVYNRWGLVVHALENIPFKNELWDGTYKGEIAAIGTYVFKIRVRYTNGEIGQKQGTLFLER